MYYKTIGEFLEAERKKRGITIASLAAGICNISTYARYEKDSFIPDKFTLDAILERMGKNPDTVSFLMTNMEARFREIRIEIEGATIVQKKELLDEYAGIKKKRAKKLHQQYMWMVRGNVEEELGHIDAARQYYEEAFCITQSKYCIDQFQFDALFSKIEFELLLRIYLIDCSKKGLESMERYLSSLGDNHILKKLYYSKVLYKLAGMQDDSALFYIDMAMEYKKRVKQFSGMNKLLEYKSILSSLTEEEITIAEIEDDMRKVEGLLHHDGI